MVEGVKISKSRDLYGSRIFPTTKLIKNVAKNDSVLYVQGGSLSMKKSETDTGYSPTTGFPLKIVDNGVSDVGFGTTGFVHPVDKQTSANIFGDELISDVIEDADDENPLDILDKATRAFEKAQEELQKGNLGKYQELIDQAQQYVDLAIELLNK